MLGWTSRTWVVVPPTTRRDNCSVCSQAISVVAVASETKIALSGFCTIVFLPYTFSDHNCWGNPPRRHQQQISFVGGEISTCIQENSGLKRDITAMVRAICGRDPWNADSVLSDHGSHDARTTVANHAPLWQQSTCAATRNAIDHLTPTSTAGGNGCKCGPATVASSLGVPSLAPRSPDDWGLLAPALL